MSAQEWNREGINNLFENGVTKILCTSKYVLKNLGDKIICARGAAIGEHSPAEANQLQSTLIDRIGGDNDAIVEPVARVFMLNGGQMVSAITIPSPGSSQRSVQHFGYITGTKTDYATRYFENAFRWLLE